jgi:hypothetical protein
MPMLLELNRRKRLASDDLKELEVLQTTTTKKKCSSQSLKSEPAQSCKVSFDILKI